MSNDSVNERKRIENLISTGNLPDKKLYPVPYTKEPFFTSPSNIQDEAQVLNKLFEQLILQIKLYSSTYYSPVLKERDQSNSTYDSTYDRYTWAVLNANSSDFDDEDCLYEAAQLCPFITQLDKYLVFSISDMFWGPVYMYDIEEDTLQLYGIDQALQESPEDIKNKVCVLVSLYKLIQFNELFSGFTIDLTKINSPHLLTHILSEWGHKVKGREASQFKTDLDWDELNDYFIPLSPHEHDSLIQLFSKRLSLSEKMQKVQDQLEIIAEKTNQDWELFLQLIYDIFKKEDEVIQAILNDQFTALEKLPIIEEYEVEIQRYKNGQVLINGKLEDTTCIFNSVEERLKHFPLTHVRTTDSGGIHLDSSLLCLAKKYDDFNYFLIKYHYVRLRQKDPESVLSFIKLSTTVIRRNLNPKEYTCLDSSSISEAALLFYESVSTFYHQNKEIIDRLDYHSLQTPTIIADDDALSQMENAASDDYCFTQLRRIVDPHCKSLITEWIDAFENDSPQTYEETLLSFEGFLSDLGGAFYEPVIISLLQAKDKVLHRTEQIKKETFAHQIVVSLDIIYLFCDVLGTVVQDPERYGIHDKDEYDKLQKNYKWLVRFDRSIISTVYPNPLDNENVDIEDARIKSGVDSKLLSEQEQRQEKLRNASLKSTFDDFKNQIFQQIDKGDIAGAFSTKGEAREKLAGMPVCEFKQYSIEWLDSFSRELCEKIVKKEKHNIENFSLQRNLIMEQLGRESQILPQATLDSLTTAEYLYNEYVTEAYAEDGFDYSCISSLYYQAFEEAYNALIWRDYAKMLNKLEINGQPFFALLGKNDPLVEPYMYKEYKDYRNYCDSKAKLMRTSCMYKPFSILIKDVAKGKGLLEFRNFFAKKAGFTKSSEMQNCPEFTEKLKAFSDHIERAIDDRNNASHGGLRIDAKQCEKDKWRVINNMESVRKDSIGLLQQLLYLLNWNKND